MAQDNRARLKQWLETGEVRLQPLAFPQREIWEASPVPAADVANQICCFVEVRGAITHERAREALQRVVDRQEALRTSFLPGKERPVQMIRATGTAVLRIRELSSSEGQPAALEEVTRETFETPFDLLQGPLYRAELLRRGTDDHVLVLAIHHAIADGWTLGVFVQDLCMAYILALRGIEDALPPVPLSYSEWGAAERAFWQPAELETRARFWKSRLAGSRQIFAASRSAAVAGPLRRAISQIPAALVVAVRDLTRRTEATLFSVLLAAFQLTLSKWTNVDDILVGTPVANRGKEAFQETMGYFAGVVPLRGQVERDQPFAEAVRSVHRATVDAFANAMPFAELCAALGERRGLGEHVLFDVRFALQNHPIPDVSVPGLSAKLRMRSTGTARFDLGCEITEEGADLEVVWLSREHLFSPSEMTELDQLFQTVLAAVCSKAESRTAALAI